MAKTCPPTPSRPKRSLPGGAFLLRMIAGEKRRTLSIAWPNAPERPRAVRLRLRPQPGAQREETQPVTLGDFQLND